MAVQLVVTNRFDPPIEASYSGGVALPAALPSLFPRLPVAGGQKKAIPQKEMP